MNILFATPYVPAPPNFGGARRMYELIRGVGQLDTIQTLSLVGPGDAIASAEMEIGPVIPVPVPVTARMAPDRQRRLAQLRSLASRHSFQYQITHVNRFQAALDQLTASGEVHLVQFEFSQMGSYMVRGIPSVLDVHNIEHDVLRQMAQSGSPARRLFNQLEYRRFRREEIDAWRRATCCIATSARDAATIERQIDRPVPVIPNGVDLDYFDIPPPSDNRGLEIVFTGAMRYRPNAEGAVWFAEQILPLIQRERPDAHFSVVGADPPAAVRALADRAGVTITGTVDDVRPWLQAAQIVVVPLLSGGGTRLKLLEAFASGRPVVSTRIGAEGIDASDNRELLIADEPAAFAHAVLTLAREPDLRARLTGAARELVRARYQWSAISAQLREVHGDVLTSFPSKLHQPR
jgi:glycosyltransferase involved in cell wall biosynthesis